MNKENYAIDHSGGKSVKVFACKNGYRASVWIYDDGVGIFNKIASAMGFEEKSFAILELAKGMFTTDPSSHTGEGVFFSSKVMDDFAIISDGLVFFGPKSNGNAYIDRIDVDSPGTCVMMEIKYDHSGIDEIGQGFADELFRVFANQHPSTKLTPVNCNAEVDKMIRRVRSADSV